jgi:hypothetical protein
MNPTLISSFSLFLSCTHVHIHISLCALDAFTYAVIPGRYIFVFLYPYIFPPLCAVQCISGIINRFYIGHLTHLPLFKEI